MASFLDELCPFDTSGWECPHFIGHWIPSGPGIYVISAVRTSDGIKAFALYVGIAKNLKRRLDNHEIMRGLSVTLREPNVFPQVFFQEKEGDLRKEELNLIHQLDPPFNIVGRRGRR